MEGQEGPTDTNTEGGYQAPSVLQRANEPFTCTVSDQSLSALHHQKVLSPETWIDRSGGRAFYGNFVLLAFERVETQEEGGGDAGTAHGAEQLFDALEWGQGRERQGEKGR